MLLYLDTNIYGRPFDDQSFLKIRLESEAVLILFQLIEQSTKLGIITSDILYYEIKSTNMVTKRLGMQSFLELEAKHIPQNDIIVTTAKELTTTTKLHARDALHLASSIISKATYFVTCDNHFFKKRVLDNSPIKIISPIDFPFNSFL